MASQTQNPISDPRLQGEDFKQTNDGTNLFVTSDEPKPLHTTKLPMNPLDPDEHACTLLVKEYPQNASLDSLRDSFVSFGFLRSYPLRTPHHVKVVFNTQKEAQFAFNWFADSKQCRVAGHLVDVVKQT